MSGAPRFLNSRRNSQAVHSVCLLLWTSESVNKRVGRPFSWAFALRFDGLIPQQGDKIRGQLAVVAHARRRESHMKSLSGRGNVARFVVIMTALFLGSASLARAQKLSASDVENWQRADISAWSSKDATRIVELEGPGGVGFGYRTTAARTFGTREEYLASIQQFFAAMERYRITQEEIHTAVDGDIGLAWGFFTEDFQIRGRAPEKVRVRFTVAIKREAGGWRQLVFHRDVQPFDEKGAYIPVPVSAGK